MNDTKINYNILYCIISIYIYIILFATSIQIQELIDIWIDQFC